MLGYLVSCFILLIPIFLWNIVFVKKLPEPYKINSFWDDVQKFIKTSENILRAIVFFFPLFLKLEINDLQQKIGFLIYMIRICVYFTSYITFSIFFVVFHSIHSFDPV